MYHWTHYNLDTSFGAKFKKGYYLIQFHSFRSFGIYDFKKTISSKYESVQNVKVAAQSRRSYS